MEKHPMIDCPERLQPLAYGLVHRAGLSAIRANTSDFIRKREERHAEAGWEYRDLSLLDYMREGLRLLGRPEGGGGTPRGSR